jgi:hypothetical protein
LPAAPKPQYLHADDAGGKKEQDRCCNDSLWRTCDDIDVEGKALIYFVFV